MTARPATPCSGCSSAGAGRSSWSRPRRRAWRSWAITRSTGSSSPGSSSRGRGNGFEEIGTAEIPEMLAHTTETRAARGGDGMTRAEDVERHVAQGARGQIYDLRVDEDGGRLVLRGRCRTYYVKQLAQQAALE